MDAAEHRVPEVVFGFAKAARAGVGVLHLVSLCFASLIAALIAFCSDSETST